jgi:hypothetical protein
MIREIATRLLLETDWEKVDALMAQLTRISEFRLSTLQPD